MKKVEQDRPDDRNNDHRPNWYEDGHVLGAPRNGSRQPIHSKLREHQCAGAENGQDYCASEKNLRSHLHASRLPVRVRRDPKRVCKEPKLPNFEWAAMKWLRRSLDEEEPTLRQFAKVVRGLEQRRGDEGE